MAMELHAQHLDLRGLICPLPLIRLGEQMLLLAAGECCQIIADDPGFADDLPDWCQVTGQQLVQLRCQPSGEIHALVAKLK